MANNDIAELRRRWNGPRQFIVCEKLQMLALLDEIEQLRAQCKVMHESARSDGESLLFSKDLLERSLSELAKANARIEKLEAAIPKLVALVRCNSDCAKTRFQGHHDSCAIHVREYVAREALEGK